MSLDSPNLDNLSWADLVSMANARIRARCPQWNDLSPHDPGMVLVDIFAHLTETMLYRLNQLPDKAYVEFLRLIGVRLQPPTAASTTLRFTLARASSTPVEIPQGTRVTASRANAGEEPVVFVTAEARKIEPGQVETSVLAHHCEPVEAELAGRGTGEPGFWVRARRAPILARLDLVVAVEATREELTERMDVRGYGNKAYRIWREVETFATTGPDDCVYVVDRMNGVITFAPAAEMMAASGELDESARPLGAIVRAGREVRLWYCTGGGPGGNLLAGQLDTLKTPIPAVSVDNPQPATGGRAAETIGNALVRGPQELHSLRRAVTASDFEMVAVRNEGAVARAKAFTQADLWSFAKAGTVEVLLVPALPVEPERASAAALREVQSEEARARIARDLDMRRPLGTACQVNWASYKTVRVIARVVANRAEDTAAIRTRLLSSLHAKLNPLPAGRHRGWPFGRPLRGSDIYDILLGEPGVSYVDSMRLVVDHVPDNITALAGDAFQDKTWYAGAGDRLFRSLNDGESWELIARFPDESIETIETHGAWPGLVAVSTNVTRDQPSGRVRVSWNCGETWEREAVWTLEDAVIDDLAFTIRDGVAILFLATSVGLYELALSGDPSLLQVLVDEADQSLGFYAVAASIDPRGTIHVSVAARDRRGVYLSAAGGKPKTFSAIGLKGNDVRVLAVQRVGPRSFLWAGEAAASGLDAGPGCQRCELLDGPPDPDAWSAQSQGWDGGSCFAIAFAGPTVLAATHRAGVLWLDPPASAWARPELGCGLPLREKDRLFHPVAALATMPGRELTFAGGPAGLFATLDRRLYTRTGVSEYTNKVSLPATWLFCSGDHEIEVVSEDAS